MAYHLSREQLLRDLHRAYLDARRHKRNKPYQQRFERNLDRNIEKLCDELWSRTYAARPSTCFIITDPKPREVFAADFRDRIVHHLYYNYTHDIFERTFIQDSYSCIEGRGTHYGISRLEQHIRQESQNYQEECFVLKVDIRGYFMHINRNLLLDEALRQLRKMSHHHISRYSREKWSDIRDMEFIRYLTREIILLEPTDGCRVIGTESDWTILPADKSLFNSSEGCGLPIGNLTSQLFSNVYLNRLDHYMKRELKCRHYGRYVDDFFVVSADRDYLKCLIPEIRLFLDKELGLTIHGGKLQILDVRKGVEFLGAYLKPGRRYVSRKTLMRMKGKLMMMNDEAWRWNVFSDDSEEKKLKLWASLNSILGVMSHYRCYHIRKDIGDAFPRFQRYGAFDASYLHFHL